MEEIKAVIFDCDGTLIDSEQAHFESWRLSLNNHGGDLTLEEYFLHVGKSAETNAKLFAEKIGYPFFEEILKEKRKHYHILQKNGFAPIQATIDFILCLSKQKQLLGFKMGVASAAKKADIMTNLNYLQVESLFEIVLSGQDDLMITAILKV